MDKVREALEEKLGAARKRLTDLTISEIMDTSLVDAFDLAADAAREALALQEAGEAKVRYAGWSPDKGNHYLIESSQPSPAAIRRERERCAKMADAWERPDALRLAAGEMTAQEMRTARAVAKGIAAAIRSLPDQPPAESSPGDAGESAKQPPPVEGEVVEAARAVIAANADFRDAMKHVRADWEGDPLQDAIDRMSAALSQLKGEEG